MATNGKTPNGKAPNRREELRLLLAQSDTESLALVRDMAAAMTHKDTVLEQARYPMAMMEAMMDTGARALSEKLKDEKSALYLFEDLMLLALWMLEATRNAGKLAPSLNRCLDDTISDLSHRVIDTGGAVWGPHGPVYQK